MEGYRTKYREKQKLNIKSNVLSKVRVIHPKYIRYLPESLLLSLLFLLKDSLKN